MADLRKYGEAATLDFSLFEIDGGDLKIDAVHASGDTKIMKDESTEANTTNGFIDEGQGYSLTLTATEMEAARITINIVDQGTKAWLDPKAIIIETYGHASAQHPYMGEGVWDRQLIGSTHNVPASSGRRLRAIGDVVSGSVDDASATTLSFITDLTGAQTDHYSDQTLLFTSGNLAGMSRSILNYNESTKLVTIEEALPEAPANGDDFDINPVHIHPVSQIVQEIIDDPTSGLAELLVAIKTRLASIPYASEHPPTTVTVTDGTIVGGTPDAGGQGLPEIQTINQAYLKVNETGMYKIDTEYSSVDEEHPRFYVVYRYFGTGSTNHKIEAKMWNYQTSAWDDVLITNNDFPATNEDRTVILDVPGTVSDYYDGSIPNLTAKLRIEHTSNPNAAHNFWLDAIGLGNLETIYSAPDNAGIAAIEAVAGKDLLQCSTIDTLASQTSFTLTEGSADDDTYNNAFVVITDSITLEQKAVGFVSDYVGSTRTVTLSADPGIFTIAINDVVCILGNSSLALIANTIISEKVDTLLDINKPQTLTVGVTTRLEYQWKDSDGDPVNIAGLTFAFKAVENTGDSPAAIPDVAGTISDAANGRWYFDILPTSTFKGKYEIWSVDGASKITPLSRAGGAKIEVVARL